MLKTFMELLGDHATVFRRYAWMAAGYGVLCGLTTTALVPVVTCLLHGDLRRMVPWLAIFMGGVLGCWVLRRNVEEAGVRVGVAILQSGRHRLGEHVARLPVGWFNPQNTARLSHVATQGMMAVAQIPAHVMTPLIAGVTTPLVLVVALFGLHAPLGVIALAVLPLLAGVLALSGRLSRRADQAFQRRFGEASGRVVEFAQAQSVLRAFNGESAGTRWLDEAFETQRQTGKRLVWISAVAAMLNIWAVQMAFAVLLIAAAHWLHLPLVHGLANEEVVAAIVSLVLIGRFIDSLLEVVGYGEVMRGARGHLDAIGEVFSVVPLHEPGSPQPPRDASVELRAVRFRYAATQDDVLRGVSLHVPAGSMTAVIGESGSGKTTLMRLIARFYDVDEGSVLVGGVDVRAMTSAQLAGYISQIFQDSYLFTGSIADNIRLWKPLATDAEVMQAAWQAGVGEIIARLPQGLATPVGEGGARLSGGERQRIAIARALIRDSPILLVDEATAALDAENQAAIAQALTRLRGQRTVIVIAHQLSTVAMADQIVVLERGRVIEQGTPAQLRGREGRYAQFLRLRDASRGWRIAASAGATA